MFLYGVSGDNQLEGFQAPEKTNSVRIIEKMQQLRELPAADYFIYSSRTVISDDAIAQIDEDVREGPTKGIFWTYATSPIESCHSVTVLTNNSHGSLSLSTVQDSNEITQEISSEMIYIPEPLSKHYLEAVVDFFSSAGPVSRSLNVGDSFSTRPHHPGSVSLISYPWQILNMHEKLMTGLSSNISGKVEQGATLKGPIIVEEGAEIYSGSYIEGPVWIARGASVGPNCFLRPSTYIGENCHVGQSVEIKNSIIMRGTQVGHLTYIGDSIIGPENNFGAGSKTANLAFHNRPIKMTVEGKKISTGRRKLGIFTGEKVKTGINSSLMPGVRLFSKAIAGAHVLVQRDIPPGMMLSYDTENVLVQRPHGYY